MYCKYQDNRKFLFIIEISIMDSIKDSHSIDRCRFRKNSFLNSYFIASKIKNYLIFFQINYLQIQGSLTDMNFGWECIEMGPRFLPI